MLNLFFLLMNFNAVQRNGKAVMIYMFLCLFFNLNFNFLGFCLICCFSYSCSRLFYKPLTPVWVLPVPSAPAPPTQRFIKVRNKSWIEQIKIYPQWKPVPRISGPQTGLKVYLPTREIYKAYGEDYTETPLKIDWKSISEETQNHSNDDLIPTMRSLRGFIK